MNREQLIKNALNLRNFDPRSARLTMSPLERIPERAPEMQGSSRVGAVLIVLFVEAEKLKIILIQRCEGLPYHPGQISFPGGRLDPGEEPRTCALRETSEEIGIEPVSLRVAGFLDPVYIRVSDFLVYPFVAWHPGIPSCRPDPREVAAVFRIPLTMLCTPEVRTYALKNIRGNLHRVPGFSLYEHHIWGATAMLLGELIERLKAAGWRE